MSDTKAAVGYRRPPKEHQIKKGQSGNPSGRPKSKPSLRSDLEDELAQLTIDEDGGATSITKSRALAKALVRTALTGDLRAINTILSFADKPSSSDSETPSPTDEDQEIINDFVNRTKSPPSETKP